MNRSIKTTGTIISRERVIAVIESIMGMQTAQIQSAYSTSLMKRTMDDAESQAISLIQDMSILFPPLLSMRLTFMPE